MTRVGLIEVVPGVRGGLLRARGGQYNRPWSSDGVRSKDRDFGLLAAIHEMSERKKLSIVIAVFNGAATLQAALDSIRREKTPEIELVVVDGQSTDATVAIVERNADLVDRWISERDDGIYSAWNKGLALASGDWIAFVGADDWYAPGGLTACLEAVRRARPDTEFLSSRVRYHALFGAPFEIGRAWDWQAFQRHMTVAHVGAMHHRSLYARVGRYDERYRICGDYELLLRARDTLRAEFFPVLTAEMGGGGVSNNQLRRTYDESSRAKHEAGGRPAWRCRVERGWDFFRARVKRRLGALAT